MKERLIAVLIGYLFGCLLTAELVARRYAGQGAAGLGETGNPGMANIMASLGFVPGILTLLGDLAKTLAAALLCARLFPEQGWIITLYAGLGTTLGHDFPFWRRFRGGKGVAATSMALAIYCFPWGLLANIFGMLTVFATQYLCIAGPVIPASFVALMAIRGDYEAAGVATILTGLSFICHWSKIAGVPSGQTGRTDVLGAVKKKLGK